MPRLAANLSMLFTEHDFLDRFQAARAAGFQAVEYLFPYDYEPQELVERLKANALTQVLHNLPAGNWAAGERGIACLPDRVDEFKQGVDQAIRYAQALHCPQVNCLVGMPPADADPKAIEGTVVSNLRHAAGALQKAGIALVIEPLNHFDAPGFYLTHTAQAVDLIKKVGSDNLKVQYDVYHMQRMEGELANTIKNNLDFIGHIQIADNPGRHEPGSGEINYPWLLQFIDAIGYRGWVSCEYKPAGRTEDGLHWIKTLA